jgi:hypothetical protein
VKIIYIDLLFWLIKYEKYGIDFVDI